MNLISYLIDLIIGNNSLQFYQGITPILILLIVYLAWLVNCVIGKIEKKINDFFDKVERKSEIADQNVQEIRDEISTLKATTNYMIMTKEIDKENNDEEIEKEQSIITKIINQKVLKNDEQIVISSDDFELIKDFLKKKNTSIRTLRKESRIKKL